MHKIRLAGADIVWVGPPKLLKRPSNGVVAMIEAEVPAHSYFPSNTLAIPRTPDRVHATLRGYDQWSASLWQWLKGG